jgi:hypothetical protein
MEKMAKLILGIANLNASDLIEYCRHRENALKNNPHFPEPKPSLAALSAKRQKLREYELESMFGSRRFAKEKNKTTKELRDMLRQLANYVTFMAKGDPRKIESAGFKTAKKSKPLPPPREIRSFSASRTDEEGQIKLQWDRAKNAISFRVEYTTENPYDAHTKWVTAAITTKKTAIIDDLLPGTYYWFRVTPMNSRHIGIHTNPKRIMAA